MRGKLFSLRSVRPPDQLPGRTACNWLLLCAALAICFHFAHLPAWLSSFAACILLWRLCIENYAWRVPSRWVRWSLLLVTAILVFRQYGTLLGRDPGVAYLTLLVALKILEIRILRDYLLAIFLIYLLTLGALLFSQSLLTGLFMGFLIVLTTHTLILLNRPQTTTIAQSLRLAAVLCLQALPLLLVLYLLFPRIQGTLWGLPQDAFSGRTGLSEQVSPGSINRLYNDDTVAFRVEFDDPPPAPRTLYWRAFVLSDTDGSAWSRHRGPGDGQTNWRYSAVGPALTYTIVVEPHHQDWLPALDLPASVQRDVRTVEGYSLEAISPVRFLKRYPLTSHLTYITDQMTAEEFAHNQYWPRKPSNRVRRLLGQWRQQTSSPREFVKRALRFFNQEPFYYTLTPPLLSGDILDEFLFETRAGYCEHYASAFVALMRLNGIPARLVAGYQGGEWNAAGSYMVVRQSDAHAWAEVWLHKAGWTRVDPTAAVAPERIELGADAIRELSAQGAAIGRLTIKDAKSLIAPSWLRQFRQQLSWRWDVINSKWNGWVMDYNRDAQFELLKNIGIKTPNWLNAAITMTAGIIFLLLLLSAVWLHRRRRPDPVLRVYYRFCDKLARVGLDRSPTEGPLDYSRRLIRSRADLRDPIMCITAAYVELRYGYFSNSGFTRFRQQVAAFKPAKSGRNSV